MGKEAYEINFYAGADYGLNPSYAGEFSTGMFPQYRIQVSNFGIPADPRTANQLKAVSDKLNTGAKTIEVSGLQAATWETVPEPHLEEIYRLKKLVGADLTFHGPLVEPTGVTKQGWDESQRMEAERQMWQAVERAHKMDPSGNIIVTFHSSHGLPTPETKVMEEVVDPVTGKKELKEVIKDFWVVSQDGQFQSLQLTPNFFMREGEKIGTIEEQKNSILTAIDKMSKDAWYNQLQGLGYHAYNGQRTIQMVLKESSLKEKVDEKHLAQIYKDYISGKDIDAVLGSGVDEEVKAKLKEQLQEITHGDLYLRDAYQGFQKLYNQAYKAAEVNNRKEDLDKLRKFRDEVTGIVQNADDPSNVMKLGEVLIKGVNILRMIEPPKTLKPLRDFGVEKSAETFANIAFNSYKKFGETAPIVSVENPPVGQGLARAQDLRDIVERARKNLQEKLIREENLSEQDAEKQAKKLIGATWDVGHINMLRKYGYEDKHITKEAETISEFLNKIHLSDNFGMEHTELPMGMGNVNIKKQYEALAKYNEKIKEIKQIVETGNWFGPQAFGNQTPFAQTLKSFGSPVYAMKMGPYWNQAFAASGGYSAGYGTILPEQHFSIMYGSGFSGLPRELGGQISGRSRLGGTPME